MATQIHPDIQKSIDAFKAHQQKIELTELEKLGFTDDYSELEPAYKLVSLLNNQAI